MTHRGHLPLLSLTRAFHTQRPMLVNGTTGLGRGPHHLLGAAPRRPIASRHHDRRTVAGKPSILLNVCGPRVHSIRNAAPRGEDVPEVAVAVGCALTGPTRQSEGILVRIIHHSTQLLREALMSRRTCSGRRRRFPRRWCFRCGSQRTAHGYAVPGVVHTARGGTTAHRAGVAEAALIALPGAVRACIDQA